jgi:hypothetical protein
MITFFLLVLFIYLSLSLVPSPGEDLFYLLLLLHFSGIY